MSPEHEHDTGRRVAPPPVFLERQGYRRRRLADAARLLPLLGAALFAIPLLWPAGSDPTDVVPTSSAIAYIFICWAALIAASAIFGFAARLLTSHEVAPSEQE